MRSVGQGSSEVPPQTGAGNRTSVFRAYRLLALVLFLRPFGNLCLAWGMKHFAAVLSLNPFVYLRALMNPFVALGIAALVLGLLTRMALLSLADLSFVLPLTASGYIVSTFLGKFFLSEQVSSGRWLGTVLIFVGTALVSFTSQTTPARAESAPSGSNVTLK
jgi:drug/metabolite transporter (DMT)-like permease